MSTAVYGWVYAEADDWKERGRWVTVASSYEEDLSEVLAKAGHNASAVVQLIEKPDGGIGIDVRLHRASSIQMHPNGRIIGVKGSADEGLLVTLLNAWAKLLKARPHRRRAILQGALLEYEAFLKGRAKRLNGRPIPWKIEHSGKVKPKSSPRPHRR